MIMTTLQIGEYSAWICIEETPAPIYKAQITTNSAECWVASEVGKVRVIVLTFRRLRPLRDIPPGSSIEILRQLVQRQAIDTTPSGGRD